MIGRSKWLNKLGGVEVSGNWTPFPGYGSGRLEFVGATLSRVVVGVVFELRSV